MKQILIVDDEPEVRELVEVTLRAEDYQIYQAKSRDGAIKSIEIAKNNLPHETSNIIQLKKYADDLNCDLPNFYHTLCQISGHKIWGVFWCFAELPEILEKIDDSFPISTLWS